MKYDYDFIDMINEKIDLLAYISNDIDLKKHGDDYYGHCPLHVDKTPSFSVSPESNKFYCFSCHHGGGIIQYLMAYEGMTYDEAVDKACQLTNIDLSKMCVSPTVLLLKALRKLKKKEIHTPHKILKEGLYDKYSRLPVPEWEAEGISKNTMTVFEIRVDESANRIVYPVRNIGGQLINVKGRTRYANYKEMGLAKYINYYTVGTMDYFQGLDITFPYIKARNEVIIFESIKSVMKCYDWGIKNCVSVESHNISPEQLRLLLRLKVSVVLAFDSDVSLKEKDMVSTLNKLKKFTNVYVLEDREGLLGGKEAKNSPADCGYETFRELYENKRRIR